MGVGGEEWRGGRGVGAVGRFSAHRCKYLLSIVHYFRNQFKTSAIIRNTSAFSAMPNGPYSTVAIFHLFLLFH